MAIDGIYWPKESEYTQPISGRDPSQLNMNDFLNLLTAQMTNQDMMNPMEDTEFIAQMAQFSSLQGIQTIQEYQLSSYAASYAGKYVTVADTNALGELNTFTGKVEAVTFYDGTPKVQVNGKSYDLFKVMEVSDSLSAGSLGEAAQYIGKTVTVLTRNEFNETKELTGLVTGVTIIDNVAQVIIDGKEYPVSTVKKVDDVVVEDDDIIDEPSDDPTAQRSTASGADADLARHVAAKIAAGISTDPADYSYEEIMAYAHSIASPRTGSSVRTAQEIAALMMKEGSML